MANKCQDQTNYAHACKARKNLNDGKWFLPTVGFNRSYNSTCLMLNLIKIVFIREHEQTDLILVFNSEWSQTIFIPFTKLSR